MTHRAGREIEVKLEVTDRRAIVALFDVHAGLEGLGFSADGTVVDRLVLDRYVDTRDRRLEAAGLRARLRTEAATTRLTLKSAAAGGRHGIHDRLELEAAATGALDPARWPASEARSHLIAAIGEANLTVIARLRQQRRTLVITRGPTAIDLSLDDLEALSLESDVVQARTTELEAELLRGSELDLELLAVGLLRLPGLRPATRSKLDWAASAAATAAGAAAEGARQRTDSGG